MRRGLGKGMGKGYRNIIGKDPRVHSQSARGMKQPQKITNLANVSDCQLMELYKINVSEDKLKQIRAEMNKRKSFQKPSNYPGTQEWNIYLNGKWIDTVFYDADIEKQDVLDGLIGHDGYDPGITIRRGKLLRKNNPVNIKPFRRFESYQSKENRDKRYKELVARYGDKFRRTSRTGQIMHPQYIEDYEGEVETGIGNTQYRTLFPVVYHVELKHGLTEADLE